MQTGSEPGAADREQRGEMSAEWRPNLLAASVHYLHGTRMGDSAAVREAREGLSHPGVTNRQPARCDSDQRRLHSHGQWTRYFGRIAMLACCWVAVQHWQWAISLSDSPVEAVQRRSSTTRPGRKKPGCQGNLTGSSNPAPRSPHARLPRGGRVLFIARLPRDGVL